MKKRYKVYARPKKNLGSFEIAHEHLWNRDRGVYDRIVVANSKKEARMLYKDSYLGKHCVVLHIEEI